MLADDAAVQLVLQPEHLAHLVALQLVHRHARPLRHDRRDVLCAHHHRGARAAAPAARGLEAVDGANGGRLVNQVDRLVGQEAVVDVPLRQLGRRLRSASSA